MAPCYKHYEHVFHNGLAMNQDPFDGLTEFLAVAEHKSFTLAASQLGVTPTAVSHAVKTLERRTGVLLFQRTTRRVALTEAGSSLFIRLRPAASEIGDALAVLGSYRDRPMGTLRLTAPRLSGKLLIEPWSRAIARPIPTSGWRFPWTMPRSTWSARASMPVSAWASRSKRTWSPCA